MNKQTSVSDHSMHSMHSRGVRTYMRALVDITHYRHGDLHRSVRTYVCVQSLPHLNMHSVLLLLLRTYVVDMVGC